MPPIIRATPLRPSDPRKVWSWSRMLHPGVVLDAALPVADAMARLEGHAPGVIAVIRRQTGLEVVFYGLPVGELRRRLTGVAGSLDAALGLAALPPLPTLQHRDLAGPAGRAFEGLVLDGDAVLGIARPARKARVGADKPAAPAAEATAVRRPAPTPAPTPPPASARPRGPFGLFGRRGPQPVTRSAESASGS